MFTYNYRLFDRYARPIASLAVLADEDAGWRPDHYGFEVLGCRHTLEFPVVKLIFALVTVAHLRTRQTKNDHHILRFALAQGVDQDFFVLIAHVLAFGNEDHLLGDAAGVVSDIGKGA